MPRFSSQRKALRPSARNRANEAYTRVLKHHGHSVTTEVRMPEILEPKDFEQWEKSNPKETAALMKPAGSPSREAPRPRTRLWRRQWISRVNEAS
jgi:hypothetical protein